MISFKGGYLTHSLIYQSSGLYIILNYSAPFIPLTDRIILGMHDAVFMALFAFLEIHVSNKYLCYWWCIHNSGVDWVFKPSVQPGRNCWGFEIL